MLSIALGIDSNIILGEKETKPELNFHVNGANTCGSILERMITSVFVLIARLELLSLKGGTKNDLKRVWRI